jgi:hypothetical protein
MKLREGKIHGQPCYPQVSRQSPGGRESSRGIAEVPRPDLVANLAIKLLVERFSGHPIKPNHFKCYDRTPAPAFGTRFLLRHSRLASWKSLFHFTHILKEQLSYRKL